MEINGKRIRKRYLGLAGLMALLCLTLFPCLESGDAVPVESRTSIPAYDGQTASPEAAPLAALTFDDGPHPGTTDRLLDGLRDRGVHATFFLIGAQLEENRELVERMDREGHQIGNHTWSHQKLADLSTAEMLREVEQTNDALCGLLGNRTYWVRPPYGLLRPGTAEQIPAPMVTWTVDPRDWESRDREKVVQAVLGEIQPGAVVLLHDIYPTSVDAALDIADALCAEGWELVTVEELMKRCNVTPEPGVLYRGAAG